MPPLHPLLVNFTAALLPVAVLSDVLARWRGSDSLRDVGWWTLLYAAIITPFTVAAGWYWYASGGHSGHGAIEVHRVLGTALAVLILPLAWWRRRAFVARVVPGRAYVAAAGLLIAALAVQGHIGASLSFGGGASAAEHGDASGGAHGAQGNGDQAEPAAGGAGHAHDPAQGDAAPDASGDQGDGEAKAGSQPAGAAPSVDHAGMDGVATVASTAAAPDQHGGHDAAQRGASAKAPPASATAGSAMGHDGHAPAVAGSDADATSPDADEAAAEDDEYLPVVMPNIPTLPWKLVDGVKVFHLVAEPVRNEFAPGLVAECWGYNGTTPGPLIEAVEGDRVRIYVSNRLPEATTVHWHGVLLPNGMDGVAGLNQKPIEPGETFAYEFTLRQHGTLMYHPHFDEMTQMAMGMMGMFVIHPKRRPAEPAARDYAIILNEWFIEPGTTRPDPLVMTDFNLATFNSKAFPGTAPLVAKTGERVRVRFGNLSAMNHHPIHLHGHAFNVVATDGGEIAPAGRWPETTVLVPVGSTRTIEFIADNPGDWAFHCHMTHHIMNQMGHDVPNMIGIDASGLDEIIRPLLPGYMTMGATGMGGMAESGMPMPPNSIPMSGGPGPFSYIDMGGMLTVLKVRDELPESGDAGWYENPRGTVASPADPDQMRRDGIEPLPHADGIPSGGHTGH